MPQPPYRCEDCLGEAERCTACRARRAAANAERREQRRQAGVCILCGREPLPGLTRCSKHSKQNAVYSGASHYRSRRDAKEGT